MIIKRHILPITKCYSFVFSPLSNETVTFPITLIHLMLYKSFYNLDCTVQSNFHSDNLDKRTVSIKRPVEIFFKKYLLNVQYDLKIKGLNALTTSRPIVLFTDQDGHSRVD